MATDTFHSPTFLSGKRKVTTKVPTLGHSHATQYPKLSVTCLLALLNTLPLSFLTQSSHITTTMSISFTLHPLTSINYINYWNFLNCLYSMDYMVVWPGRGQPLRRMDGEGWGCIICIQTVPIVLIACNVNLFDYRNIECINVYIKHEKY